MLREYEAKINRRLNEFEHRINTNRQAAWDALDGVVTMIGEETGNADRLIETKCREENKMLRADVEALRGELALLRATANRPQKASNKPRAPFALSDDDEQVFRN